MRRLMHDFLQNKFRTRDVRASFPPHQRQSGKGKWFMRSRAGGISAGETANRNRCLFRGFGVFRRSGCCLGLLVFGILLKALGNIGDNAGIHKADRLMDSVFDCPGI